jgi:hypothetical protein
MLGAMANPGSSGRFSQSRGRARLPQPSPSAFRLPPPASRFPPSAFCLLPFCFLPSASIPICYSRSLHQDFTVTPRDMFDKRNIAASATSD